LAKKKDTTNSMTEVALTSSKRRLPWALGGLGLVFLAAGAVVIPLTEEAIRQGVKAVVVLSDKSEYKAQLTDIQSDYFVHIFNATNVNAALAGSAKIHFEMLSYEMEYREENFDFDWHRNKETLEYKSWWTYVPVDDMDSDQIVQVNAVYLAALADFGNSEEALFIGLSGLAVASVDATLDAYIYQVQLALLPTYLSTAPVDAVTLDWSGGTTDDAAALGFECASTSPSPSPPPSAEEVRQAFNASSPTSVVTQATFNAVWRDDLLTSTEPIAECLRQVLFSSSFASFVVPNATGWTYVKGAQFGSGALTEATLGGGAATVAAAPGSFELGLVVAPELFASYGVELDPETASTFLRVYSNDTENVRFATILFLSGLSLVDAAAQIISDPVFASTGVSFLNIVQYATYLYSYIPESYFLKGLVIGYLRDDPATLETDPRGETSLRLRPDGTGQFNSGLFTRRSPRELVFGYHDRIFDIVPENLASIPFAYYGLFGLQYASVEEQREADPPLIYEVKTGKGRIQKVREYTKWRNATVLSDRRSILGKDGGSFSCDTWEQQGYESCNVWLGDFTMTDMPVTQLGPFKEGNVKNNIKIWSTEMMRAVPFEYDDDVTVRGIKGRKYKVKEEDVAFTANCSLEPLRCDPSNAFYRAWNPSYILPMATVQGGARISMSFPSFGKVDEFYRRQTTGLPPFKQSSMGTFVVVEPLTGFFIHGHLRLQYCFDLDRNQLTSAVWTQLFESNPNVRDVLYWPLLWFDDTDKINKGPARSFRRNISLPRLLAFVFTIILLFVGLCFLVAAFVVDKWRRTNFAPTALEDKKDHDDDAAVDDDSKVAEPPHLAVEMVAPTTA